ncbi:hypothetical protein Tco_1539142 [Tanacetum coccineum]
MTDHVANLDKENQKNKMVNVSLTAELERYKERVAIFKQRQNVDLNKREKLIDSQMDDLIRNRNAKFAAFQREIDTLKEILSNQVKEKESLSTTLIVFKTESKEKESKYIDKEIVLKNQNKELENILYPSELPKVSLVNESLKKLKYQLASFDKVVKKRATFDAISADEKTKVQTVFNQMKAAVNQCSIDKNAFEIHIKQLSIDNDQLLKQIMSQEIVHIAVSFVDILNVNTSCVDECNKCLKLETGHLKKKDLIEKDDNFRENQNAPTFNQLCEINELKAQSQKKDTVIRKLKDRIKSLSGKDSVENVKKDTDEIETINIKLEHSVAKLLFENENLRKEREYLKSIYKDQFDSIRKTRVQSKEHCDSIIAQLQEKVFANAALKNELKKLKGKNVVDNAVSNLLTLLLQECSS